uniref:Uncharacterized protein n=1 Tax=Timema tahoe TaxID=61484 RepID=A0A7R9IMT7_9NEOP|nr:unnamed protein product [Timema tahoe]
MGGCILPLPPRETDTKSARLSARRYSVAAVCLSETNRVLVTVRLRECCSVWGTSHAPQGALKGTCRHVLKGEWCSVRHKTVVRECMTGVGGWGGPDQCVRGG